MPIFLFIVAGVAVVMALCAMLDIINEAIASSWRVWGCIAALVLLAALCIAGAAVLEANSCT